MILSIWPLTIDNRGAILDQSLAVPCALSDGVIRIYTNIANLGFPKGGGRVPASHLIVSNYGSMLIRRSTHDTNPTIRLIWVMML